MATGWTPPDRDRALGLEFYATATPGAGGALKQAAEEFRVTEISSYPMPDDHGAFTVLRVASRNWEQHELAQRIAQTLGLPPHALTWAGTKDRRAVSERLFSYRGDPPASLALPDVELQEAYRAREGLVLGHHYGNSFEVFVPAGGDPAADAEAFRATLSSLRAYGGFPNFFGPQRFGEVRPVTHDVGRALVRGDPAAAVDLYLTQPVAGGEGPGVEARAAFAAHRDPARALREFPPSFRFERALLEHLARGQPAERALRALSRELRTLFVHAYQSFLFNRWLSARHARGLSMTAPLAGDTLLRVARDGTIPGTSPVPVSSDNLPECAELAQRGRAVVAGPLVGHATPRPEGVPGELLAEVLSADGLGPEAFRLPKTPDLASAGSWRAALIPTPPIAIEPGTGRTGSGSWFRFSLPKGSYATVLLREFTKTDARPPASDSTRAI